LRGERPPKPKGFESGANTPVKVKRFFPQEKSGEVLMSAYEGRKPNNVKE